MDILLACYNGARYLPQLLSSIEAQTHQAWTLWARDDGSSDDTARVLASAAGADPRVRLLHSGGPPLGATRAFGWLMDHIPGDPQYIMFADQDDVWLPMKIERTLAAMRAVESVEAGPVLVHTDLAVVDVHLAPLHESFWRYSGSDPEPATLRRLVVQNVVTGATVMVNAALRSAVGKMPAGAVHHDWWYACVAVAHGRIVAVRESTILYRQHGANVVGAVRRAGHGWHELPARVARAMRESGRLRATLALAASQATAFLEAHGSRLPQPDRDFLDAFGRIPRLGFLQRKMAIVRLRLRREDGVLRNLGVLLRG